MSELLREKRRIEREGLVIREITNVQVKIPDCCQNGGKIKQQDGSEIDCPHVIQRRKAKKGNVGM